MDKRLQKLYKKLELMRRYDHAMGLMGFDFETCVPVKAMEREGDTMSFSQIKVSKSKKVNLLKN